MSRLTLFFLFAVSVAHSQLTLSGVVIDDKSKEPIPLVNVYDSFSGIGTITDSQGKFAFAFEGQKSAKLVFSHIAFDSYYEIFDSNQNELIITMRETLIQMNDVVVTSTRNGYLLRDVPIATEVIGKKEINESGATTISDLLEQRAGVSTSTNVDGGAIFNMLGLDSRYILILKNGQPITGQFNNRVDLNHISTNNLKKIEITKGPGSAIYGTDAMGGVINIITEDLNDAPTISTSYRASSFGGTPKQISNDPVNSIFKSSINIPFNNLNFSTDLTYQHFLKGQQFEYISADQIDKLNFNNEIDWQANGHDFRIAHQKYNQVDEGATRLSSGLILYTNETNIDRNQVTVNHRWTIKNDFSIEQTIRNANYVRNYKVNNNDGSVSTEDATEEKNTEYELLFNRAYSNLVYNGGFEFSKPEYKSDRIAGGVQKKDIVGIFNQVAWNISSDINLVSGLRFDTYGDTTVLSPRLALSYKKSDTWIYRLAYGHGFRAPSFMESLIDWQHLQFGYTVQGNPNLKPEVSKGFTLGVEFRNKNNFQLSTLLYNNTFSNLIKDYAIEPGLLSYRNIEKAYFTGIEIITKWTINSSLSSSFTFNYVKNEDKDNKQIPNTIPLSIGGRLSYAPGNQKLLYALNFKGTGEYYPQEFNPATGDYLSSEKLVKPYLTFDAQVIYKASPAYQIIFGSKNIGDHTNQAYGPYIGRTAYFEIKTNYER
ncbi:MAG: TonB-dependent receptor [Candidatus Marinimicrobia bacterium]|nr:TonB-dependent receptor [Candidatus Neomarinimicrobiota bacterium]